MSGRWLLVTAEMMVEMVMAMIMSMVRDNEEGEDFNDYDTQAELFAVGEMWSPYTKGMPSFR